MKLYYQWTPWAYSHIVANIYSQKLKIQETKWLKTFKEVFEKINQWHLWIIPIENSYAGNVHENFFHLAQNNIAIYEEHYQSINHCLVSYWKDIWEIKKVISHYQALLQCEKFIKKSWLEQEEFFDTAWSAKYIQETQDTSLWAICSNLAWEIYWLNILSENIQDKNDNSTRFFLVWNKWLKIKTKKKWKTSIIFTVKDWPSILYKCLWAFATRNINLSKIQSIPSQKNSFEYMFRVDFEESISTENSKWSLQELKFFTKSIKILWSY